MKGLTTGGKTGSAEKGNNWLPDAEGEIVFTPVFKDDDNRRVLDMHKGLCSNIIVNYLVTILFCLSTSRILMG